MLWEEHNLYFILSVLKASLQHLGFFLVDYQCYQYPVENALVAIAKNATKIGTRKTNFVGTLETKAGDQYASNFTEHKSRVRQILEVQQNDSSRVVVLGAGHLAATFINLMDIQDIVDFVLDDDPNKHGLFMPGCGGLRITDSSALLREDVGSCLLTQSPESQKRVLERNREYLEKGGVFRSIFPIRNHPLPLISGHEI